MGARDGTVCYRELQCTCAGDVLDVVSLLLDYASCLRSATKEWSLQPVLPRQEFFTKEIRRLLHGGGEEF